MNNPEVIDQTDSSQSFAAPCSLLDKVYGIARRNMLCAFITVPLYGLLLTWLHDLGKYPELERVICGTMGLSMGWGFGMMALAWVLKFDAENAKDHTSP